MARHFKGMQAFWDAQRRRRPGWCGIWWHQAHHDGSKNTCANGPAALGFLRLARLANALKAHFPLNIFTIGRVECVAGERGLSLGSAPVHVKKRVF
jgi:hypothetical protein